MSIVRQNVVTPKSSTLVTMTTIKSVNVGNDNTTQACSRETLYNSCRFALQDRNLPEWQRINYNLFLLQSQEQGIWDETSEGHLADAELTFGRYFGKLPRTTANSAILRSFNNKILEMKERKKENAARDQKVVDLQPQVKFIMLKLVRPKQVSRSDIELEPTPEKALVTTKPADSDTMASSKRPAPTNSEDMIPNVPNKKPKGGEQHENSATNMNSTLAAIYFKNNPEAKARFESLAAAEYIQLNPGIQDKYDLKKRLAKELEELETRVQSNEDKVESGKQEIAIKQKDCASAEAKLKTEGPKLNAQISKLKSELKTAQKGLQLLKTRVFDCEESVRINGCVLKAETEELAVAKVERLNKIKELDAAEQSLCGAITME